MIQLCETIARLQPLPSPRGIALELSRLSSHDDVSVADIVHLVQADPALAARLIRAANSARVSSGPPIASVHAAVLRLGLQATRQIALGFSLVNDYRTGACNGFDYAGFWKRSLLRAVAAQAVVTRLGGFDPAEALVCGLLAGIGRLAFACARPEAYSEVLAHAGASTARLRAEEAKRFGVDHTELGVALMEEWRLPERSNRAVSEFNEGRSCALALAEAVSQGIYPDAPLAWSHVALETGARLGVDAAGLDAIAAFTNAAAAEWAPLLAMPVPATAPVNYSSYAQSSSAAGAEAGGACTIVIADDSEDDRFIAQVVLERAGYRVLTTANGDDALNAVFEHLPDIVLVDWDMPRMDGLAVCRALRDTDCRRLMHLILYTGRSGIHDLVAGIEAGADDFVVKAISWQVLLARVKAGARSLQKRRALVGDYQKARRLALNLAAQ